MSRTRLFAIGITCVLFSDSTVGAGACLPERHADLLQHYLVWSDEWLGTTFRSAALEELKVLNDDGVYLVYSPSLNTVFSLTENRASGATCPVAEPWLACMARLRRSGKGSSIRELLSGLQRPPAEPVVEDVCSYFLPAQLATRQWKPSGPSACKNEILRCVSSDVLRVARYFGALGRAVCNNFNTKDPDIWVVAETSKGSTETERMLFVVNVYGCSTSRCLVSVQRPVTEGDSWVLEKVIRDHLELPIHSKSHTKR
jgi:hypothetical protein